MKRQSKIKRSNPGAAPSTAPPSVITNNLGNIAKVLGVLAAALLALTVWKSSQSVIQNLVNADAEVLKGAIFGDTPYMFYCARGGKNEIIPAQFSEVNALRGSNVGFAMVNCSQMLPSGKNLWERFKLKKEWRPTLFAAAPWLRAPLQVNPTHMKDGKTLAKFVDTSMAPKPTEISSDKELRRYCGFDKANVTDVRSITDTCLILLRGSRYSKIHSDLERKLVQAYPRVRMAAISASKRRLSLEEEMLPADHFALKLHALRNGTHYLTMVNPATWDYMNTFVGQAVGTPLYGFSGEGAEPIRLIKAPAPKKEKKVKAQKGGSGAGGAGAGGDKAETGAGAGSGSGSGSGSGGAGDAKAETPVEPEPAVLDPAEVEAERVRRESLRRAEMERQQAQNAFEAADEEEEAGEEEEDEEMIEL
ncbi:hypothetical protein B484DRAFT_407120 [Ochromonadaceae sp. CCMP2298]|nr:hypothetical protein B484DRAFT_407120 [Ochromonadaceae sp. CCMP2298]